MAVRKALKVLVVSDTEGSNGSVKSLLEEIDEVDVTETFSVEEILSRLVEDYPDIIFAELDCPEEARMELFRLFKARHIDIPVVFIAESKEYAVHSIKSEIYDFLLKPVEPHKLRQVVEKYRRGNKRDLPGRLMEILQNIREETKIRINSRYSYVLIDPSEIVFCKTDRGYTAIYLSNGKEEVASATLSQIEELLNEWNFHKLSRSVLINLDYVRSVDKIDKKCVLKSGEYIWDLTTSHKGINELLLTYYSYG